VLFIQFRNNLKACALIAHHASCLYNLCPRQKKMP